MSKKVYDLMDWAAIEEVVYGEAKHPEEILGPVNVGRNTLVRCLFPGAKDVYLYIYDEKAPKGKKLKEKIKMEMHDEAGYFAALLPGKGRRDYVYHVEFADNKKTADFVEYYTGDSVLTDEEIDILESGSCYDAYKYLGAHPKVLGGHKGIAFVVYAPNAYRVSVVGDFNDWDGLRNQMSQIGNTGYFEHFVPDAAIGTKYKYEILVRGGEKLLKTDPFSVQLHDGPNHESVVERIDEYKWDDADYMEARKSFDTQNSPMNIYELSVQAMGRFSQADDDEEPEFINKNIKDAEANVIKRCKEMHYTHVELMPVTEYVDDWSCGYKPVAFYALSSRFGQASDYQHFVNALHKEGIGVILDLPYHAFDSSEYGIAGFDGTCVYEHEDSIKGIDPETGCKLFNYGRAQVMEYLISNANFLLDTYHFDGFKLCNVTNMLYLDYFKQQWIPNMYGGNENLEAIAFIKEFNKVIHKRGEGIITIADEKGGCGYATISLDDQVKDVYDKLGFDYTLNNGFMDGALNYMELDPIYRSENHGDIVDSSIYQHNENYIVGVNHSHVDLGSEGLSVRMPGEDEDRMANLRAFYGHIMTRPGKKMIIMGQDKANEAGFDGTNHVSWKKPVTDLQIMFSDYMKALNKLYLDSSALYALDTNPDGFEWINSISANENVVAYLRKTTDPKQQLLVVINFANCLREKYKIGVPLKAKYKEIFNSDDVSFGGKGVTNPRLIPSKLDECDGRDESIRITLAPLTMSVFSIIPYTEAELKKMEEIERQKEEKRIQKEKERIRLEKEKEAKRKTLEKTKAKIKRDLMKVLERKYREAEKAIENGSEFNFDDL